MFEKILFATTASPTCDDAAKVAFELSKKNRSKLFVYHVYGVPTRGFSSFVKDSKTGETEAVDENYRELVAEEMRSYYEKQLAGRDDVVLEAVVGDPGTEILRKARRENADLIIMGAHARQEDVGASRHRAIVGSTMQRVARTARCPALIISRPCVTCWSYFANIMFGADFSKQADHAFQFALNVAKDIGCKLHVFHAVEMQPAAGGGQPDQAAIERNIEAARKKIQERYLSKAGDFDNYVVEVWEGSPHVEILKYARENKVDLIVMAHHAKIVEEEEAVLGSTIEQVVLRSSCPVLSVNHPDKVEVSPYGARPASEMAEA